MDDTYDFCKLDRMGSQEGEVACVEFCRGRFVAPRINQYLYATFARETVSGFFFSFFFTFSGLDDLLALGFWAFFCSEALYACVTMQREGF